ncbi:MAG: hypothetical protein M3Z05_19575, partial [Gemmatimonadota bacterium]|nr:hypothetical protein [Gemmatimonadota bacterium]
LEYFASVAARSAELAKGYLSSVVRLTEQWRGQLSASPAAPRLDAAAWAVIGILPAHPMITAPAATAATGRAKSQIYQALEQLEGVGVLIPTSTSRRNRSWEVAGLIDLIEGMESGDLPISRPAAKRRALR